MLIEISLNQAEIKKTKLQQNFREMSKIKRQIEMMKKIEAKSTKIWSKNRTKAKEINRKITKFGIIKEIRK